MFVLTTATVIFYAFGYRFNLERGIFVYTGAISIKSNPETVDIRVDGVVIPRKNLGLINNSILISGLTPGEYFIEVSADGYQTWSKKAYVESGFSTEFWNVLLPKIKPALETISETRGTQKLFPAPKESLFAAARSQDGALSIDVLDTQANVQEKILVSPQTVLPADGENIEWSPDNRKMVIPLARNEERAYVVASLQEKTTVSLQDFVRADRSLSNPRWDATTRNFLFYLRGTTLFRANTEALDTPHFFIKDNVLAYDISGSNIYYLSSDNGIIYRVPANGSNLPPLQITTVGLNLNSQSTYRIVVYDENRIAIREIPSGKLWIYNKFGVTDTVLRPLTESGTRGVQFSNDGKKLLFFGDTEMAVYFTADWEAQPLRDADTTLQLARFSNPVKNVQWTEDYEHVLYSVNETAYLIELDNRDRRNILPIVTFPTPILQALSRFADNRLYFTLAEEAVNFMFFPNEETNLFGF